MRKSVSLLAASVTLLLAGSGGAALVATSSSAARGAAPAPRMVFSSTRTGMSQLYALDPVGNRLSQLTFGGDDACPDNFAQCGVASPTPSPDGSMIAFEGMSPAVQRGLWVARSDGTGLRLLAPGYGPFPVAWSPDSRRLAYPDSPAPSVFAVRIATFDGRPSKAAGFWKDVRWLGWSPDGRRLAVQFRAGPNAIMTTVELVGVDGWVAAADLFGAAPAWSPDSRTLALAADGRVELVGVDGAHRRVGKGSSPAWSPDGRRLAYLIKQGIRVVEPGRRMRVVLALRGTFSDPQWSPDGARLAFRAPRKLNVVVPGTRRRTIIPLPEGNSSAATVAWTPDGRYLVERSSGAIRLFDPVTRQVRTVGDTFPGEWPITSGFTWLRTSKTTRLRAAEPLGPVATPDEVRTRQPVGELAADGSRVALQTCLGITVWEPAGKALPVENPLPLCDPIYHGWGVYGVALARDDTVWSTGSAAGNSSEYRVVARPPTGGASEVVGDPGGHFRYRVFDELAGYALGHGPLLVFGTMDQCPSSCSGAPGGTTVERQWLWRLRERGYEGACPARDGTTVPGRCQLLVATNGPLVPLAVDDSRVVVRRADGAIALFDSQGAPLLTVPFAPGVALGAELDASDLVVLTRGTLRHHESTTGRLLHAWSLPDVPSAGFCGLEACGPARLRLEDVAAGIAVYVLDGKVHLLRLADGAEMVVADGHSAQLEPTGLWVAHNVQGRWPGRVRFTPFAQLPLR